MKRDPTVGARAGVTAAVLWMLMLMLGSNSAAEGGGAVVPYLGSFLGFSADGEGRGICAHGELVTGTVGTWGTRPRAPRGHLGGEPPGGAPGESSYLVMRLF